MGRAYGYINTRSKPVYISYLSSNEWMDTSSSILATLFYLVIVDASFSLLSLYSLVRLKCSTNRSMFQKIVFLENDNWRFRKWLTWFTKSRETLDICYNGSMSASRHSCLHKTGPIGVDLQKKHDKKSSLFSRRVFLMAIIIDLSWCLWHSCSS